jgi:hypothetical protein
MGHILTFSQAGTPGTFHIKKPTTQDVMRCSGTLANSGMKAEEGVMGAELCAAFNRSVGASPEVWYKAGSYYKGKDRNNEYAGFFHSIGINHRSYAFAYDDVNDQSSVAILGNDNPPSRVTLTINW